MTVNLPSTHQLLDGSIDLICRDLSAMTSALYEAQMWPEEQLLLLCRSGAPALFLPPHIGGVQGAPSNSLDALILLSEACVSSTFVFTQHLGALKRLVHRDDSPFINRRIKDYMSGKRFASLGLSHLHSAKKSMLNAKFVPDGIEINGRIPWVTGASKVDDV